MFTVVQDKWTKQSNWSIDEMEKEYENLARGPVRIVPIKNTGLGSGRSLIETGGSR